MVRSTKKKLLLGGIGSNVQNVVDVAFCLCDVGFSGQTAKGMQKNFKYLQQKARGEVIYGVNTGFGPMAHVFISKDKQIELQYNLIRSHAMGMGELMSVEQVRAIMFVRLQTLLKAHSGISAEVCDLLVAFLNKNITPLVYKHGSVGASGDLVQLAHIAEALIGEGQVMYNGRILKTSQVFKTVLSKEGFKPLKIQLREGLALINGTSAMTGIAALNIHNSKVLAHYSILMSALMFEIVQAPEDYFSEYISSVRSHVGQKTAGAIFNSILKKSKRIKRTDNRDISSHVDGKGDLRQTLRQISGQASEIAVEASAFAMKQSRQEIYSIRCAVQVLGPIIDELINATTVVETEINSVTDNPITFTDDRVVHGGNFHGDYISYEMDKLKIAMTKLSMFSERKINFLVNDKVNKMFPPFLNQGVIGLDLGLQGLQFVATSTTAENQSLSMPVSIHSIPTNNDNQDIVSMGTNSALIAEKVIANTFDVLAIELMACARAVDALCIVGELSPSTRDLYMKVKECISSKTDLVLRDDVQQIVKLMQDTKDGSKMVFDF